VKNVTTNFSDPSKMTVNVSKDTMMLVKKNVKNAHTNVSPVNPKKNVKNVVKTDLDYQIVNVSKDSMKVPTKSVDHVHTDVKNVENTPTTVKNVLMKPELTPQNVHVKMDTTKIETSKNAQNVTVNVPPVPTVKDVPLVLVSESYKKENVYAQVACTPLNP
jgi:hypothetical protein